MVFTDPPYGINYQPEGKMHNLKELGFLKSDGDYRQNPREFPVIRDSIPIIAENCESGAPIYICTGWQEIGLIQDKLMESNCHVYSVLIWDRITPRFLPRPQDFLPVNEFIVYGWRKGKTRTHIKCLPKVETDLQKTTIWRFQTMRARDMQHTTQKPVELSRNAILISSEPDTIVADYFGGGGSTLIACEQTGRRCYMMELDQKYCQVIIDRYESYTGKKAIKVAT